MVESALGAAGLGDGNGDDGVAGDLLGNAPEELAERFGKGGDAVEFEPLDGVGGLILVEIGGVDFG